MPRRNDESADAADAKNDIFEGQVRATRKGYYGGAIREEGEKFHFKGVLGTWMEEVKPSEKADG